MHIHVYKPEYLHFFFAVGRKFVSDPMGKLYLDWHQFLCVPQSVKELSCTRWFKYDRDKLWLVYTQSVPVIFEPPCIYLITSVVIWLVNSTKTIILSASSNVIKPDGSQHTAGITPWRCPLARPKRVWIKRHCACKLEILYSLYIHDARYNIDTKISWFVWRQNAR